MTRNFQQIKTQYWDSARNRPRPLTPDEIYIELYLITCPQCGPSGAFITSPETIGYYTGIGYDEGQEERDLWRNGRIQTILQTLQDKGRIKLYPGGWVWIYGKWEFESKNPSVQKALFTELESMPRQLVRDFVDQYEGTLTEEMPSTLSNRLSDTVPHTTPVTKQASTSTQASTSKEHKHTQPIESEFDGILVSFVKEILPGNRSESALRKQVAALDKLLRLDREKIAPDMEPTVWQDEVFAVLRALRADTEPRGDFPGWSAVFNSIDSLRKNGSQKYQNARGWYLAKSKPGQRTFNDRLTDDSKFTKTGEIEL